MLLAEAKQIHACLDSIDLPPGSICLNIGSSTATFRQSTQPFIHSEIIQPLHDRGIRVVNCDLKADEGVDEVGDLMSAAFREQLKRYRASLVLCSNLLEHVTGPAALASACSELIEPGGYLVITVPRSFPFHPDPLDTMYRPRSDELSALLPQWNVIFADEIRCGRLLSDIDDGRPGWRGFPRLLARALLPMYKPNTWFPAAHSLLWLVREYEVSAVVLQRPA